MNSKFVLKTKGEIDTLIEMLKLAKESLTTPVVATTPKKTVEVVPVVDKNN
jgi:hypothetical protein